MRTSVSRFQRTFRQWWPTLAGSKLGSLDETRLFSEEQLRFLAGRGVVYLAEGADGEYSAIVAPDFRMAIRIAGRRGANEKVIGLMGAGFLPHLRDCAIGSHADDGSHGDGARSPHWIMTNRPESRSPADALVS